MSNNDLFIFFFHGFVEENMEMTKFAAKIFVRITTSLLKTTSPDLFDRGFLLNYLGIFTLKTA